jgi:hypothetical protein
MDESGDLGFDFSKSKTSKCFIVTFLLSSQARQMDKIVRKTMKGFSKVEIKRNSGVLHAFKERDIIVSKLLEQLARKDARIITMCFDKTRLHEHLNDEKHILYNYIVNILLDKIITDKLLPINENIEFVVSKRETSKYLNENFVKYIEKRSGRKHDLNLSISLKKPHEAKGLQVVDFVSWAIYQKYEHNNNEFYDIIKDMIVSESALNK